VSEGGLAKKLRNDNERGARENLIEDLFYDFHRSRAQVYKMNFIRGIFFGLGSVLGGTIVVAVLVWLLGAFINVFPPLADFINGVIDAVQRRR
jgi:hypothetical protein